jgi:hypothetical protein
MKILNLKSIHEINSRDLFEQEFCNNKVPTCWFEAMEEHISTEFSWDAQRNVLASRARKNLMRKKF